MIRRLALLVALLVPAAGLAQASGEVLVLPSVFGRDSCEQGGAYIAWTSGAAVITDVASTTPDFFRILVSTSSGCEDSTTTITTGTLVPSVTATGQTQRYPVVATIPPKDLLTLAGVTSCTAAPATVYVCVQHWPNGGGGSSATPKWANYATVGLEVADPPVPVILSVAPGDSSLYLTWSDDTSTDVDATSWEVTAVGPAGSTTQAFTGSVNQRLTGLTNGVTYTVTVTAISAGGNRSAESPSETGTPQPVQSFWDQYKDAGGREEGGCGGGPAGLVSLLGLALALRALRRRS